MSVSWAKRSKALREKKRKQIEEPRSRLCGDALPVVLFGSQARGDATAVSDLDALIES